MNRSMKCFSRMLCAFLLCVCSIVTSCYDDSALQQQLEDMKEQLKDHESRLEELERLVAQQNTNIESLQAIITALQGNDYVTGVTPIKEGDTVIGYTITFSKSGPITIYNGKDGNAPAIGVKQDADNSWCWTIDGEWLLDSNGEKVRASAVIPKLKIVDGYWYVSYDGGKTWAEETLGQATGDAGYTMFADVSYDELNVYIIMQDGQRLILPHSSIDLTNSGTANCYIVSQTATYRFRTVKGNSNESVGDVASAEVLWESFGTDVTPSFGDLIKSLSCKDGYVVFQTAGLFKEGNAVIAAKDASNNILWSWHIWFTDQPEEQIYINNAGTMMDRNLGATSAAPGDVGAFGLLYQWGRKDPFMGSSSSSAESVAVSTITWPSVVSSDSNSGTIEYATSHPTTFITYDDDNNDWYYTGSSSTDNTRWTTSDKPKSIYDPCPAGWRVPDGGSDSVWDKAGIEGSAYDSTVQGVSFDISSSSATWYPASGYRNSFSGELSGSGWYGSYWSASPYEKYAYDMRFSRSSNVEVLYCSRACGCSVRCVKVIDGVAGANVEE